MLDHPQRLKRVSGLYYSPKFSFSPKTLNRLNPASQKSVIWPEHCVNNAPDSARLPSPRTGTGTESKSKASGLFAFWQNRLRFSELWRLQTFPSFSWASWGIPGPAEIYNHILCAVSYCCAPGNHWRSRRRRLTMWLTADSMPTYHHILNFKHHHDALRASRRH